MRWCNATFFLVALGYLGAILRKKLRQIKEAKMSAGPIAPPPAGQEALPALAETAIELVELQDSDAARLRSVGPATHVHMGSRRRPRSDEKLSSSVKPSRHVNDGEMKQQYSVEAASTTLDMAAVEAEIGALKRELARAHHALARAKRLGSGATKSKSPWSRKVDPRSNRPYYSNRETRQTTWVKPDSMP